ncbi:MAG: ribosome recycling factor [Candidatus Sungbacteria bacterium RIFCSPLOWO2_01_FULL_60_25]|uniref:Ribosome-recycling factor n=1 Tax=Candidatus Sungbacteria bacterium RIFCSPLOWO2_01_FULL_60_25 TaxID=1802281 RepID=A0A1G2LCW9_9BACT|nr:MAG: ribosome recycling factor [Candidatus Sungbacteria bacterium RIFCSPLOWO2_01_FULL_60_25]
MPCSPPDMNELRPRIEKVLVELRADVSSLRTGRATPALVEDIEVEAYGSSQPLKTLAAISTPEPRQVLIQPWDKSVIPAMEKAIRASPLGVNPVVDGNGIRIALPPLTEERKRDLVRVLREKVEQARIQVRRIRDEAMKGIEGRERAKEISEDQKFREKQDAEKVVAECNQKIEETANAKEREIMAG